PDYVYFENSSSNPYLVRRIEELNKTANGNVEAKVVCLFRRRDISSSLNSLADSNAREWGASWGGFGEISAAGVLGGFGEGAVGTFARALDCSSSIRQPSLHMSAAAASRDITLFHAMDTLQRNGYDLARAMATLVPQGGPVLCRDEMEEWSASEAMLFEEALEKYGKDFNDIRQDFLPWKSLASIVQFYYMWKTTDRYIQQKRLKAAEADSKLKQVYIPTYTKPNPNQIISVGSKPGVNGAGFQKGLSCESCH
ncbi:metastasis-associated protein MTA2-like, partial [Passer montanus]|uniref:metastasis-associated protein MTA2-like n=1 Tax=Passer montanus TaxID=9160 RepID=UPI0019601C98